MKVFTFSLVLFSLVFGAWGAWGQSPKPAMPAPAGEFSGMYTFLQEGEFLQITVEEPATVAVSQSKHVPAGDPGNVTGFVSRFGNLPSDQGTFLDQFLKHGTLQGNKLDFVTDVVHGTWYEFRGTVERAAGKAAGQEGLHLLKGTLIEHTSDSEGHTAQRPHEVEFRSFPKDKTPEHPARD